MPADLSFGTAVLCARPARPAMPARASFERSHLRTWPACSCLVPSLSFRCRRPRSPACHARCRACVDATDANSAAHSPGNSGRGPAVYDDDDISHPALASAISPSRPGPTFPSPPSPPVPPNQAVAPLFFSECSGSTTSEAWPTGGPAASHASPSPPAWIDQLHQPSRTWRACWAGRYHCFSTSHGDNSVFQEPILRPS